MTNLLSFDREFVAAGVPCVALAPSSPHDTSPLVIVLHLMDPPRSRKAMAAALPLRGLDAWRVYLTLPMFGERMQVSQDEFMRLLFEDGLMNVMAPVIEQASSELMMVIPGVRSQLGLGESPLALVGGSAGGAAVLLALLNGSTPRPAAVSLVNPALRMTPVIEAAERDFHITYNWTDASRAKAAQLDLVARAKELVLHRPRVPLQIVIGREDQIGGLPVASRELYDVLSGAYEDASNVSFVEIDGLGHALANEPGVEPEPQSEGAKQVDETVTDWLRRFLVE